MVVSGRRAETLAARFWSKVNKNGPVPPHRPELGPCWIWTGSLGSTGYGAISGPEHTEKAHRVAWFLQYGEWSEAFCLHKCDNPICVRWEHLFEGTAADNMRDCVEKNRNIMQTHPERALRGDEHPSRVHPENLARGDSHYSRTHPERLARGASHGSHLHPERMARGTRVKTAKLTPETVREARALRAAGWTLPELAAKFGVSKSGMHALCTGKNWGHVT